MRVGIVGSEAAKFTADSAARAQQKIREILLATKATEVVSGACHLGGIDIWAAGIGKALGLGVTELCAKHPQLDGWLSSAKRENRAAQ